MAGDITNGTLLRRVSVEAITVLTIALAGTLVAYGEMSEKVESTRSQNEELQAQLAETNKAVKESTSLVLEVKDDVSDIRAGQAEFRASIQAIHQNQQRILDRLDRDQ